MKNEADVKKLQQLLKGVSLLHVEDNESLLEKGNKFFKKLFGTVYQANNGKDGFELFKEYRPDIIITDIQMPVVDGLEMARAIRKIDSNVKIIVTTAFDNKEYLLEIIEIGIECYLKKPLSIDALTDTLYKVAQDIADEKNKEIFNNHLYNIFNNQENLLFMIHNESIVLVNDYSLDFFGLENLSEFRDKFKDFGSLLLPHDTFFYEHDSINYLQELKNNQGKLYNVKIIDKSQEPHHLLLKLSCIKDKEDFYILSLNDITELHLLALFDKKSLDHEKALRDEKSVLNLLKAAKESQAKITIHNYYKGLSVTNSAVVTDVSKEKVVIKTVYLQQKAIAFEKKIVLTSELFPFDIESSNISTVDFDNQSIEFAHPKMIIHSPTMRQHITLAPDSKHTVTMFYNEHKFDTEMHIVNMSINSIKLSLSFLPAGLKEEESVTLNMVLNEDKKPIIIHTQAMIYRVIELKRNFELVLMFEEDSGINKILVDYIAKRQMKLIREFKGLQYEK